MQSVLKGSAGKIRAVFTDSDGAAASPTAPKVTITRDSDGAAVATAAAATNEGGGVVSFTLTAGSVADVDLLHVAWSASAGSAAAAEVAVVDGFLCSLEDISLRLEANVVPPPADLRALREVAERRIEDACGVAFRPSYRRERMVGDGAPSLLLSSPRPTRIISASIDGGDDIAADTQLDGGAAIYAAGWTSGATVDIAYAHGYATPPEPISRATIALARHLVLEDPSNVFDRATSYTTEEATYSLVTPGVRGMETPIPEVNAVINAYREVVIA